VTAGLDRAAALAGEEQRYVVVRMSDGKIVWSTNILHDAGNGKVDAKPPEWGVSNSPLIVDDLVIVICGGSEESAYNKGAIAYEKKSGKPKWSAGTHRASYGSGPS